MKSTGVADAGAVEALRRLCAAHRLSPTQADSLAALLSALVEDPRAPTAIRDAAVAVDQHLADSLVALEIEPLRSAGTVADIGSGAGLPGLPLAIALPQASFSLLESQSRKCEFLRAAIVEASVQNATVVRSRAEEWAEGLGRQDVVLARALAPPPVVLEYAAPLLHIGGVLVDWRGRREPDQEHDALLATRRLGLELQEIRHVHPFRGAHDRHLHVYLKVAATPDRFPRRAGMARKRPLGASNADIAKIGRPTTAKIASLQGSWDGCTR